MASCDVLIIGAGPTGLAAAVEGERLGLRVRIIDKIATRSDKSRALATHARSIEFYQKLGLDEEFLAQGTRGIAADFYVEGKKFAEAAIGPVVKEETPFPFVLFLSQAETEITLERALARKGVKVEYQTTATNLKQDDSGVTVTLTSPKGEETVRCLYVVGADGAHSFVRHALQLSFPGAPYLQDFILCDAHIEGRFSPSKLNLFLGKIGVLALFPLEGQRITRAILTLPSQAQANGDPSAKECEQYISSYIGSLVKLSDVRWIARFRLHHRVVNRYSVGRVFVAGDAAHIHSPAGGQGMNTGIQDAWNLMWKIAAVVRYQAAPAILETYSLERHRVGEFLLKRTDRFFQLAATDSRLLTSLRNTFFPYLFKIGSLFPHRLGKTLFRMVSQIGIRYRLSPISREERAHIPSAAPRAGWRGPDAPLLGPEGETSLFALTRAPNFHLLVYGQSFDKAALARWQNFAADEPFPLKVILVAAAPGEAGYVDKTGSFARRYGLKNEALVLLRPDGHIAFAKDGHEDVRLATYLSQLKTGTFARKEN